MLDRPGKDEIQLDLFLDYQSNVALYPAIGAYLRQHQPKLLAVWGKNDAFFVPAGAEAFRRDVPGAEIHFVDAGHFPLESKLSEILPILRNFLDRTLSHAGTDVFAGVTQDSVSTEGTPSRRTRD